MSRWTPEVRPRAEAPPCRFRYFQRVLSRQGLDPRGLRALDIGSGGGFLAEEFARLGCRVLGVDPSAASVATARRHAGESGLDIDYRVGSGEHLPVDDGEFELAYCCDVLEHVSDLEAVLREVARALAPGGLFLFDTINRTRRSQVVVIKMVQEWRWTRFTDVALHAWDLFITPSELETALGGAGFRFGEVVGLGTRAGKGRLLVDLVRARRGTISYGELSRRMDLGQVKSLGVSYMGYATAGVRGGT
ncbi:MAG TPA: bifunctional 2-polyprenyl-6-hydroxyphenol methylase/3-demethylubiquinol 3-O-methyltransferase UbiG [Segeticoccus sp.]|uniref:bifunctional 2-polyprenyl-6-hydroxyphenol methylase/3-demethylubiquinol 3-O-methyltransferase UbiG n=1 Tax=Segeticoccus sp. TaxID=2706531 RepID=UPI002D801B01|nr:bifunctional 2-polyprenyl-6-hydroxyphenol methylase/3-demethylubiquinol 3-O-methyltransferase UbiG [Segeticoccus sp.]HET8599977.1 bifunctional 2-polyprenyl-6-hydroxyphenol methylase/3-demethylubiquinol 3-O-methyltransferase UbiG [Segeticoccus sp.]